MVSTLQGLTEVFTNQINHNASYRMAAILKTQNAAFSSEISVLLQLFLRENIILQFSV